jgi:alpha-L-arabinofuranosidase
MIRGDLCFHRWHGEQMKRLMACLMALTTLVQAQTTIKVNPTETREAISPYIYGQFIEHLGHCINRGLWAEMLEDRKFFYPVSDKYEPYAVGTDPHWDTGPYLYLKASPWREVGELSVMMDTSKPYTGAETPVITCRGNEAGIEQEGIAVVAGKKYLGRIVLAGDASPVFVVLESGNGDKSQRMEQKIEGITGEFKEYAFEFTPGMSSENARLRIVTRTKGAFRVGCVSLMPADNVKGWRTDVVELLKKLNSPVYRWPGGNFVSGYDWHDGVGPRDLRPPRKNPAWKGVESNDVGIHEYMELMREINAEAFIALNTGLGSTENAAGEVAYCTAPADSEMGKLRAKNGHAEPYKVSFWAVGNEMFGNWQLGHMPLEEYVKKHNQTAEAIWKVDPGAKLIGVGRLGDWDESMLKVCADHMALLSEHIYVKQKTDVRAHSAQLAEEIKKVADAHRQYRAAIPELKGKDIRIAMDEWNYWYGDYRYGELACRYYLRDGLGVARGLHEYFRNSDIFFMANYAQTVNVLGCIKATQTAASMEATGLVLQLYRKEFGTIPVGIECDSKVLDVSAALTADKSAVTIGIVNPTQIPETVKVDAAGKIVAGWRIAGNDADAYNAPGETEQLRIEEIADRGSEVVVPGYSVTVVRVDLIGKK